ARPGTTRVGLHGQLALHPARAEDLDLHPDFDQARVGQRLGVDPGAVPEPAELRDVDHGVDLLERVLEAGKLGDALGQRHLAALEPETAAFAARAPSLLAAARGLAPAGAGAA